MSSNNFLQSLQKQSSSVMDRISGKPQQSIELEEGFQDEGKQEEEEEEEEEESEANWTEELSQYCPQLTFQERLIGFAASFGLGYLIAFFSFRFFIRLVEGNPIPFAVNYTCGHILQLLASMFLCGPQRQFRNMLDSKRYKTSLTYLGCLAATIVLIFIPIKPNSIKLILLLTLTFVQFCASVWYSLSYVPYGRRTALRLLKRSTGMNDEVYNSVTSVLT